MVNYLIRYANDTIMFADTTDGVECLMNLVSAREDAMIKIQTRKTKQWL